MTLIISFFSSCTKEEDSTSENMREVVETLWKYIDENYVYFDYKSINWESKRSYYLNKVKDPISEDSLFAICSAMIGELKDGHNFLNNGKKIYKYDYTKDFNIKFDLGLIKSKYLRSAFKSEDHFTYGIINDTIGYIHYEKFKNGSYFNEIIRFFKEKEVKKIIIDIRDNRGGQAEIAQNMIGYFIEKPTIVGYIIHKNGVKHSNYSAKIELKAEPKSLYFDKSVRVLTNRKSYSASSYFAGMMNHLPNVKLVGQITGGGGGAAASFELPNGWVVGITSNFFLDAKNSHIENGVKPIIEIENSSADIVNQQDKMLETTIDN